MSKFCENCGSELNDTDKVCPKCGTAVAETATQKKDVKEKAKTKPEVESTVEAGAKDNKKTMILIGGIAAAVIIVLLLIIALCSGGYKKPVKYYFTGMEKSSSKTYLKQFPSFMKEDLEDTYDDEALEKMMDSFEKKYGDKIKITYKVLDKTKIEKDDLDDVKDKLENKYDDEKIKVTDGYEVCVKATIKGSDEKDTSYTSFDVYKINGKWCMIK